MRSVISSFLLLLVLCWLEPAHQSANMLLLDATVTGKNSPDTASPAQARGPDSQITQLAESPRRVVQASTFTGVKVRFARDKDHLLVDKDADLVLDDSARRLVVKCSDHPLSVSYEDVQKVIIELNTHPRKAGFGASFLGMMAGGLLFGGMIATSIDKPLDQDHFVYLEYKKPDGSSAPYLLSIDKGSVAQALKIIKAAFGDRVVVPAFTEKAEQVEKDKIKSALPRIKMKATALEHPLPELRPDKALVVVTCPATFFAQTKEEKPGFGAFVEANDVSVGFNAPGTYTFFYLDPGEYFVASRAWHEGGLHMKLEPGKDYYLTQSLYAGGGFRPKTFLARHSKELVMYEVAGSLWSDWSRLPDKEKAEKK